MPHKAPPSSRRASGAPVAAEPPKGLPPSRRGLGPGRNGSLKREPRRKKNTLQSIMMGQCPDEGATIPGIVPQRPSVNVAVHKIESGGRFGLDESFWLRLNFELKAVGESGSRGEKGLSSVYPPGRPPARARGAGGHQLDDPSARAGPGRGVASGFLKLPPSVRGEPWG